MAKIKTTVQKNGFPSELNGHNLARILLWSLPAIVLLQIPGFLEFNKCLNSSHRPCNGDISSLSLASYFILPPVILLILKFSKKIPWREIGMGKPKTSIKKTAGLFGLGIGVILVAQVGINLLATQLPSLRGQQFLFQPGANLWIFGLVAIVGAPIIEELFFRGFEYSILGRRFGPLVGAIISSMTFGFVHGQILVMIFAGVLGLYLCYIYRKTGSLLPGMGLHIINNSLAVVALVLSRH